MSLEPLTQTQWTPELAAHLLNRAGFGGCPSEVEDLYQLGHEKAVERILHPPISSELPDPAWANAFSARRPDSIDGTGMRGVTDDIREARQRAIRKLEMVRLFDLRSWWLHRMRYTNQPLQEKMTLFFHGHFATSFEKVRSAYAMFLQNDLFRRHATGNWRDLVNAVTEDPAMLIYLDGIENRRESPNENYAREVMELFTLGEGHYTEMDIHEAARAFTGWQFDRRGFKMEFIQERHDSSRKKFIGRKGAFNAADIIDNIMEQPQAARWIVEKIWAFFAYESPEPEVINTLAKTLRENRYELDPVLRQMFLSRAFYGQRAIRTQIKSPVQWLVSTCRYLEIPLPEPALILPLLESLGQNLLEPPNVKGWDGGVTWITTTSLAIRYEAASRMAAGRTGERVRNKMLERRDEILSDAKQAGFDLTLPDPDSPWLQEVPQPLLQWDRILPEESRISRDEIMGRLMWRMYQSGLREKDRLIFAQYFSTLPPVTDWNDKTNAKALEAMMNTPQFQLT